MHLYLRRGRGRIIPTKNPISKMGKFCFDLVSKPQEDALVGSVGTKRHDYRVCAVRESIPGFCCVIADYIYNKSEIIHYMRKASFQMHYWNLE